MTRLRPGPHLLLVAALGAALVGCGVSGTSGKPAAFAASGSAPAWLATAEPGSTPIPVVYRNRCGVCHRPVVPGSEPLDKLQAELLRHRKRTRLTPQQWSGIEAFLARATWPNRPAAEDAAPPAR